MAKKSQPKEDKPVPQCKAILLCEQSIIEAGTGKVSLISIVNVLAVPRIDGTTKPVQAFLQLVDGIGRYKTALEIRDVAEDRVLKRTKGPTIEFSDRLATIQVLLSIPPLKILHQGNYDVVALADGLEIDRQQFFAEYYDDEGESEP